MLVKEGNEHPEEHNRAKVVPAKEINHCGECDWIDTEKCPHQADGVDLFNFIPEDCPLKDVEEWKGKPSDSDKELWFFEGTVLDRGVWDYAYLLCIPSDTGKGCHEVAHRLREDYWVHTQTTHGTLYREYSEMKGKWYKVQLLPEEELK